jgi:hypothetical protein
MIYILIQKADSIDIKVALYDNPSIANAVLRDIRPTDPTSMLLEMPDDEANKNFFEYQFVKLREATHASKQPWEVK